MKRVLVILLAGALSLGALCGDEKSDAEKANDALNNGLRAHVDGNLDEAIKDYREVLKYDPKNKFAFYNLGLIDQNASRPESAIQSYRQTLAIDADYVPALFNLAILLTESAPDEAVAMYRKVISLDGQHAGAHLNLGLLLRARGETEEGDALVARALELDPSLAPDGSASTSTTVAAGSATTQAR